jgi:hypothetical protein
MQLQTFQHPKLGSLQFTDSKEQIHSAKAKSNDINLIVPLNDRKLTSQVKQMIIDDINSSDNPPAPSRRSASFNN